MHVKQGPMNYEELDSVVFRKQYLSVDVYFSFTLTTL